MRWYQDNPPAETEEMQANLAAHYRTEDAMADIMRRTMSELEGVEHVDPDYRHPYAHPKKPGEKDHHGR